MRIVISGTHASGKSTLISDVRARHPQYTVLDDPHDLVDEDDGTDERSFAKQLRVAATRLTEADDTFLIAERGPLDFLAYLTALERLGRSDGALLRRATAIVEASLADVDLIVLLPLDDRHPISVPEDEDPELRQAMDDALLDLADELGDHPDAPRIVTITGDRQERADAVERLLRE